MRAVSGGCQRAIVTIIKTIFRLILVLLLTAALVASAAFAIFKIEQAGAKKRAAAAEAAVASEVMKIAQSCVKHQSFYLTSPRGNVKFLCIWIDPTPNKKDTSI